MVLKYLIFVYNVEYEVQALRYVLVGEADAENAATLGRRRGQRIAWWYFCCDCSPERKKKMYE